MILRDGRLLTDEVRTSVKARALFMEMFREGRGLTRNLRRMNRYGILIPLGHGGMGRVYRAKHTRLGRHVALKVIRETRLIADARRR